MPITLEERVAAIEKELAALRKEAPAKPNHLEWLDAWYGKFTGDPIFAHAMELGAKYRRSLRPGRGKRKSK